MWVSNRSPGFTNTSHDLGASLVALPSVASMDVLVVTESFLPQVNGVTNSVRRALDHLALRGHSARLIAPSGPDQYAGARVHVPRSFAMPTYRDFPIGVLTRRTMRRLIEQRRPDVIHLASPATLGHQAVLAAKELDIPTVAVYQTDLIGFAERYKFPGGVAAMRTLTRRIHDNATLNLVPSQASADQLAELGIERVRTWARGVDTGQFDPANRTDDLRRQIGASADDVIVGYVGRLAAEKELPLLHQLESIPSLRLVLVGGGPEESRLRKALPSATFLGVRHGEDLARIVASLDVFVHTGRKETFCQAAQEALASGVPVVAPRAGGPVDFVRPGVNGFLYEPGDGLALRDAVETLVRDRVTRARMSREALISVRDRSWTAIGDQLINHYEHVLGNSATEAISC